MKHKDFLPIEKNDLVKRGWDSLDIILITGDAYVDHSSFGASLLGRWLEKHGFKVGIIAQPDWHDTSDFMKLGKPNLFFGVTSGNLDSLIANKNSQKHKRAKDMYTPGGFAGKRPDRAVIVYCNILKSIFKDVPIVIGGIEASLRRIAYYDYWDNSIRRSILLDSKADILVYGMAELALLEIAKRLARKDDLIGIANTAYISKKIPAFSENFFFLPSYDEVLSNKRFFIDSHLKYFNVFLSNINKVIIQKYSESVFLAIEPSLAIDTETLDSLYSLPFMRKQHPVYKQEIPAFGFVKDSVVTHRGCYGGCFFCSLSIHQGKRIISRSKDSVIKEIQEVITKDSDFKGNILDLGGPTANMFASNCKKYFNCEKHSCLVPHPCKNLQVNQKEHLKLIKEVSSLPLIKNVYINSGVRFDLALMDKNYLKEIIKNNISGQMSVAPEHICNDVLGLMNKPSFEKYESFEKYFYETCEQINKKQYLIPYFISSYPGTTLKDMYDIAIYLRKRNIRIKQVQSYIPIPMTIGSIMYFTELNPFTNKKIHVAKGEERLMQKALLQPWIKSNYNFLKKALVKLNKIKDLKYLSMQS
jgi:uncharacterized radical SAM protein YgiQ